MFTKHSQVEVDSNSLPLQTDGPAWLFTWIQQLEEAYPSVLLKLQAKTDSAVQLSK